MTPSPPPPFELSIHIWSCYWLYPQDQKIPGCSDVYCPLHEFKAAMAVHTLSEDSYHALCNSADDHPKVWTLNSGLWPI